jgi:hypothetical protein
MLGVDQKPRMAAASATVYPITTCSICIAANCQCNNCCNKACHHLPPTCRPGDMDLQKGLGPCRPTFTRRPTLPTSGLWLPRMRRSLIAPADNEPSRPPSSSPEMRNAASAPSMPCRVWGNGTCGADLSPQRLGQLLDNYSEKHWAAGSEAHPVADEVEDEPGGHALPHDIHTAAGTRWSQLVRSWPSLLTASAAGDSCQAARRRLHEPPAQR